VQKEGRRLYIKTIADLDGGGNILGIELLDVSRRIPLRSLSEVRVKNLLAVAK